MLNRGGRMLDRSRRTLNRRVLRRLVYHRCACAAMAGRTAGAGRPAGAPTLDNGARVGRRRGVTADRAPGTAAALDCRALSGRTGWAVLGCDAAAAAAGDTATPAQRGAFLAEDAAVSSPTSAPTDAAAGRPTARDAAADPGVAAGARVAAHTRTTCNCGSRGLRRRVAQPGALAAQHAGAACAPDAKASAASSGGTALTTDADASERARHVRSGGTVQRSAFASDQPRLTACSGTQRCVTPRAGECSDIAGTSQLAAGAETGLPTQTSLSTSATECTDILTTSTESPLARQNGLAAKPGLTAQTCLATSAKATTSLATQASLTTGTETTTGTDGGLTARIEATAAAYPSASLTMTTQASLAASTETTTGFTRQANASVTASAAAESGPTAQTSLAPKTRAAT
jgi:hypothetical protein